MYDGQWRNMIVQMGNGFPLTKIQLAKRSWDRISKLSREKVIHELISTCKILTGDRDILQLSEHFPQGTTTLANTQITRCSHGSLSIESLGGKLYEEGILQYLYTIHDYDLWLHPSSVQCAPKPSRSAPVGLQSDEENLHCLILKLYVASSKMNKMSKQMIVSLTYL